MAETTPLVLTITQAGQAAAWLANSQGLHVEISHIAIGTGAYTVPAAPAPVTALQAETGRFAIAGGEQVSDTQVHITALATGETGYWINEIGAILADGTLLALWSDPAQSLAYKGAGQAVLLALDLILTALPAGSVSVVVDGNLSLSYAIELAQIAGAQIDAMRRDLEHRAVSGAGGLTWTGGGSVSSVGLSLPAEFVVAGSPISSFGTFAVSKMAQAPNTAWMGPAAGDPAAPGFRGLLAADIPGLPASKIISGVFDISLIPLAAVPTLVQVPNETARFDLTIADIQIGDTVYQEDTSQLFYVVDVNNLDNSTGYRDYNAVVYWATILGKPPFITAISALAPSANKFLHFNESADAELSDISSYILSVLNSVDLGSFLNNAGMPSANQWDYTVALSDETTDLAVSASAVRTFRMPCGVTGTSIRLSVNAAPSGASIIVNVKKNGVGIFGTMVSIDAGEETSVTAAVPMVLSDTDWNDDAKMEIFITQVGSIIKGKGLKITFIGDRT